MPNWAFGTVQVSGKKENVKNTYGYWLCECE